MNEDIIDPQGYLWSWGDVLERYTAQLSPDATGGCKYPELIRSGEATRDLLALLHTEPHVSRVYVEKDTRPYPGR